MESSGTSTSTSTSTTLKEVQPPATELYRCDDLVRHLWQSIDLSDSEKALEFFHDDVVYEDLIYEEPFVGKAAVKKFLQSSRDNAPDGLRFVLDDVSDGEDACGFTWHLELEINGQTKNITKGISFYRLVSPLCSQSNLALFTTSPKHAPVTLTTVVLLLLLLLKF